MTTSGSTDFELDVNDYIEEAFERCGLEARDAYDLRTARRSLNLLLAEWANQGVNRWTIRQTTTALVVGTSSYNLGADTIDVLQVLYREGTGTSQNDRELIRTNRAEFFGLPNKNSTGNPNQYYIDRQILPTIKLWPVPTVADSLVYQRLVRMEDADGYSNTLEVPYRFYPALAAGLAFYISLKKAPDRTPLLKAMYDAELENAKGEDRDRGSFYAVPDMRFY